MHTYANDEAVRGVVARLDEEVIASNYAVKCLAESIYFGASARQVLRKLEDIVSGMYLVFSYEVVAALMAMAALGRAQNPNDPRRGWEPPEVPLRINELDDNQHDAIEDLLAQVAATRRALHFLARHLVRGTLPGLAFAELARRAVSANPDDAKGLWLAANALRKIGDEEYQGMWVNAEALWTPGVAEVLGEVWPFCTEERHDDVDAFELDRDDGI